MQKKRIQKYSQDEYEREYENERDMINLFGL